MILLQQKYEGVNIMNKRIIENAVMLVAIFLMNVVVLSGCLFIRNKEVTFENEEKEFFKQFVDTYESEEEYEFYSLDAYYLEDIDKVFFNAKYKGYSPADDTWYEIDEVMYGSIGHLENSYCLSWDDLYGFESVNEDFQRAKVEGTHKAYSENEIKELFEEAYNNK